MRSTSHCFTRVLALYPTAFVAGNAVTSRSISLEGPRLSRSRGYLFTSYPRGYPSHVTGLTKKYRNRHVRSVIHSTAAARSAQDFLVTGCATTLGGTATRPMCGTHMG